MSGVGCEGRWPEPTNDDACRSCGHPRGRHYDFWDGGDMGGCGLGCDQCDCPDFTETYDPYP